jgi:hypothetical protein
VTDTRLLAALLFVGACCGIAGIWLVTVALW